MKLLKDGKIENISPKISFEKSKINFEFQQLGLEMQPLYGKLIWTLFYTYNLEKIKDADKICRQKGITSLPYLVGVIKRLK